MPATVLVVDDESHIVEVIQDILEARGYRVLATSAPERARCWTKILAQSTCCSRTS
jgi:CheY-like chemotaxis protein